VIATELTAADHGDEIDLAALIRILYGYRTLIVTITVLFGAAATVLALIATPIYRGEVVVTQVNDQPMGGLGGLAGQLGGLASLAGINMKGGDASEQRARAVLQSRKLVEEFIKRGNLLPELYPDASKTPTLWLGVRKFKTGVLSIKEDTRRGTITVAVNWSDAEKAARWANEVVALANDMLRTQAMEQAQRNIAFLNEQVAKTNVVGLQQVMYGLIENETKTLMLASGRPEYAFAVVDPAVTPEIRIKPQRTVMVIAGVVLGLFAGAITAFAHRSLTQARQAALRR
jgi:uncharacterized protein involved in exopolysaccharide biosynthesis